MLNGDFDLFVKRMSHHQNKILFWIFILCVATSAQASHGGSNDIMDLIGKKVPEHMRIEDEGIIGGGVKLIISISELQGEQYVILRTAAKKDKSYITDIMRLPELKKGESFLTASCSTKSDLSIINAVGIVDCDPKAEMLKVESISKLIFCFYTSLSPFSNAHLRRTRMFECREVHGCTRAA